MAERKELENEADEIGIIEKDGIYYETTVKEFNRYYNIKED